MIYEFGDIVKEYGEDGMVELEADVVIVGTGAGGAPLAYELANEGYTVIALEEGGHHTTEDFRFNASQATDHLYRDGGISVTLGLPMGLAPVGRTVGGTTTINQGTAVRMPRSQVKKWHVEYGLDEVDYEELCLLYSAVEEFLFVKKADPEVAGINAKKFLEGAKKLGLTGDYLPRNAKDCEGYGFCSFGCPSGAKQSMEVSYIPEAVKAGADVYADCRVEEILLENDRAVGFAGRFIDHGTDEIGPEVRVHGKASVLSGGSIGTPLLLLANGLGNSSGQVGRNYRCHPSIVSYPVWEEEITPHDGISQSAWVSDFEDYGFVLETTVLPPDIMAMTAPLISKDLSDMMLDYSKTGLFAGMIRDTSSGRLVPLDRKGRRHIILYQMNKEDLHNIKLSSVITAEMAFATGAKRVHTYIVGHELLESWRDVERLRNAKITGRKVIAVSGWHPMGTCRMGVSAGDSVVKPTLESWDVPDLYIVDGSVFPSALGVNPQLTIMALSIRSAGFIDERLADKGVRPRSGHGEEDVEKPVLEERAEAG